MNWNASAVLTTRLSADGLGKKHSRSASGKTRHFITYPQVENLFLKMYATNEVIAEAEFDIMRIAQPSHMTPSQ